MKKIDKEEIKKGIEIFEIKDLIIIIKTEPLIKDEERKKIIIKKATNKNKRKVSRNSKIKFRFSLN